MAVKSQRGTLIALTIFFGMVLAIIPMPAAIAPYRPDWTLLILIYWTLALPYRVNVGVAWLCGFLLDVLVGSILGVHALACGIVIYITASNYQKIRNFSWMQQSLVIGLFLALYHLIIFWISHFINDVKFASEFLQPVIVGMVFWPWLFQMLRKFRRHFKIK